MKTKIISLTGLFLLATHRALAQPAIGGGPSGSGSGSVLKVLDAVNTTGTSIISHPAWKVIATVAVIGAGASSIWGRGALFEKLTTILIAIGVISGAPALVDLIWN